MGQLSRSLSAACTRTALIVAAAGPAAVVPARSLASQVSTIDDGSFTITRHGEKIGREEFSIRRAPGGDAGAALIASATIVYDSRRVSPALRANAQGIPVAYQVEVRSGAVM